MIELRNHTFRIGNAKYEAAPQPYTFIQTKDGQMRPVYKCRAVPTPYELKQMLKEAFGEEEDGQKG